MKYSSRCWAEVDLVALRENLGWIRNHVGPAVKIMTVVKADAYGHGLKQIASLLMQSGTDVFGVANLAEAEAIRRVGRGWPILMLGACLPEEMERAARDGVMATVSSLAEARKFSAIAKRLNRAARIHLKADTGMGRLGAPVADIPRLLAQIERLSNVQVCGLYTHYSSVEDDPDYARQQRESFQELVELLGKQGREFEYLHSNNSGGVLLEPGTHFNTVRPGLLVYGIAPPGTRSVAPALVRKVRPALSWKCRVSYVKPVPEGVSLSYGRTFVTPRPMKIATLTAGYGDGYLRAGSNRAQVLIRGRRCPIVGRITMDQMLADVSRLSRVLPGDEVVMIGRQGRECIQAGEVAEWCGTVPWEVLTNITYRVPRIYRGSQAS